MWRLRAQLTKSILKCDVIGPYTCRRSDAQPPLVQDHYTLDLWNRQDRQITDRTERATSLPQGEESLENNL